MTRKKHQILNIQYPHVQSHLYLIILGPNTPKNVVICILYIYMYIYIHTPTFLDFCGYLDGLGHRPGWSHETIAIAICRRIEAGWWS